MNYNDKSLLLPETNKSLLLPETTRILKYGISGLKSPLKVKKCDGFARLSIA